MTTAAEKYWISTLLAIKGVSGERSRGAPPPPAKLYAGVPHRPLTGSLPPTLGDVRRAFGGGGEEGGARPFDVDALSAMLHYAYGYSRAEPAPQGLVLHRVVPSARCCYPAELYVWLSDELGAAAGLHYYDPAHHSLIALRPGADGAPVAAALAADLSGAPCVLLISALFWKIAYRYGAYAYRLCTQEAGILIGNALAVAAAMGLDGHVHHQFVDRSLHRWLGLRPDEESLLGVVPLYRRQAGVRRRIRRRPAPGREAPDAGEDVAPSSVSTSFDRRVCAEFLDLDARSRIHAPTQIVAPPSASLARLPRGEPMSLPPEPEEAVADLAVALRFRSSGLPCFNPTGERIPAAAFGLLCRYAAMAHVSDVAGGGHLPVGLIVAVHRIEGIAAGVYGVGPGGRVEVLRRGSPAADLAATSSHPFTVNFQTANAVVSVVGDPDLTSGWFGDRGYRILNVEAGIVAQRVCILGAAAGLFARPYNTYDARATRRVLGLEAGPVPIFQIALGRPRPADVWRTPPF